MPSWIPKSKCNATTAMENTVFSRSDVWGYLGILVRYKGVSRKSLPPPISPGLIIPLLWNTRVDPNELRYICADIYT
jgi:hypothetical protein